MACIGCSILFIYTSQCAYYDYLCQSGAIFWICYLYLFIISFFWWQRNRLFPYFMFVFFLMFGIKEVVYLIGDASPNYFNIAASIVWIIYFFRSERVKQTFTK